MQRQFTGRIACSVIFERGATEGQTSKQRIKSQVLSAISCSIGEGRGFPKCNFSRRLNTWAKRPNSLKGAGNLAYNAHKPNFMSSPKWSAGSIATKLVSSLGSPVVRESVFGQGISNDDVTVHVLPTCWMNVVVPCIRKGACQVDCPKCARHKGTCPENSVNVG